MLPITRAIKEVNTKFTNIEEHNRRKVEENRRETQEELGKIRNQVTEDVTVWKWR